MAQNLTRRDFIKLAGLVPFSQSALPGFLSNLGEDQTNQQNVLILVFDAWSAANTSLYGYPRQTTPNLEKLSQKAIVYHNHYAGSHFTSPGTASLLTGTTPWTHQAFNFNSIVVDRLATRSIFHALPNHHHLAYTHNPLVNTQLHQFGTAIDSFTPWNSLYMENTTSLINLFQNDIDAAIIGRNRTFKQGDDGLSFSLILSRLYEYAIQKKMEGVREYYPRGITNNDGFDHFLLEEGIDWLSEAVKSTNQPALGYCHFFPPHDPYNTRSDFYNTFLDDGYHPTPKDVHFLQVKQPNKDLEEFRRWYDEFILYVDAEFARFYANLERDGALENTWIILTTDHGEMFERNFLGHTEPTFYQPVFHIPLLIFPPGQDSRVDVHTNTSAIDLLPTICKITGQESPDWSEGVILPPFSSTQVDDRDITSIQVEALNPDGEINQATVVLIRGQHKLMWFFGYSELQGAQEQIELYDLSKDPDEIFNLYPQEQGFAETLLSELKPRLTELQQSMLEQSSSL